MNTSQYPFDPRVPTRTVVLRGKYRKPKQEPFKSDAAGSPSESVCSPSHLANILAVRDEIEARKLRAVKR